VPRREHGLSQHDDAGLEGSIDLAPQRRAGDLVYYAGEYVVIGLAARRAPRGLVRRLFRIPVWCYRHGLGRVVGGQVLALATRGRRSGRIHVNAMRYEHDPRTDTYFVLSGWDGATDWYRNVRADPAVGVAVGRRRFRSTASLLSSEEGVAVLRSYLARNPFAAATIRKETGIEFDGRSETLLAIARRYPAVALPSRKPRGPGRCGRVLRDR
jgi:deazaflavin-dependent oxidoreductase (nitroreductase family)